LKVPSSLSRQGKEQLRRAVEVITATTIDAESESTDLTRQTLEATRHEGEQALLDLTVGLVHLCRFMMRFNMNTEGIGDMEREHLTEEIILSTIADWYYPDL
jgi:hypothetical protein